MNLLNPKIILVSILFILSAACTHTSPRYSASAVNVEQIRQVTKNAPTKLKIGTFTEAEKKTSIMCRAAGPVTAPDGKTFGQYIKDAIYSEFKIAGIYDKNSSQKLSGKLDHIDFSSGISEANWTIRMTFSGKSTAPFTVESVHTFPGSFIAGQACQEVAQELSAATQKFILALVSHPQFKKIIHKKVASN